MGAELVPVYLLGNGVEKTADQVEVIREGIVRNGGLVANRGLPSQRLEGLDRALLGMGISATDSLEVGYLLGRRKQVSLFRNIFDHEIASNEPGLPKLSVIRFSDIQDLPDLIDKEFKNFRDNLTPFDGKYTKSTPPLNYDGLHIDFDKNEVVSNGEYRSSLVGANLKIVRTLAMFRGCVLTADEMVEEVWRSKYFSPDIAKQGIHYVNKFIGRLDDGRYLIRNKRGIGYYIPLEKGEIIEPAMAQELILRRRERGGWPLGIQIEEPYVINGELSIDFMQMAVLVNNRPLSLRAQEILLLALLALNKGRVVTDQKIINTIYRGDTDHQPYTVADTTKILPYTVADTTKILASSLKSRISGAGAKKDYIVLLRGIGRMMPDYGNSESLVAGVS